MARQPVSEQWLIFVDTNIFLDFYRIGGESADRQLKLLEKHKNLIITGDQIRMEFLKNRQKVILDSIGKLSKPIGVQVPPIIATFQASKMLKKQTDSATKNFKKVKERVEKILADPSSYDPVYKSVNKIFSHNSEYNLCRPDKKRFEIRNLARKRFLLGYPPRKANDTSIGDAINWEWIVKCAQLSNDNHHILIVSRDSDYGATYNNECILNDWLRREFKDRVSKKRKIELTNRLTFALKKLDEIVSVEDENEETEIIKSKNIDVTKKSSKIIDDLAKDISFQSLLEYIVKELDTTSDSSDNSS